MVAPEILLNTPGFMHWKDTNSIIQCVNHHFARALGFKHGMDLAGFKDETLPTDLSKSAQDFVNQDRLVMNNQNHLQVLNFYQLNQNYYTLLTEKNCIYDNDQLTGTIGNSFIIRNEALINFMQYLVYSDARFAKTKKLYGTYPIITGVINNGGLSERESECLFYLVRGHTAKMIGKLLQLSPHTVQTYIDRIKHKFKCHNKTQLIEYALSIGVLYQIPQNIFSHYSRTASSGSNDTINR